MLDIGEVNALIEWNREMASKIPSENYYKKNMAGTTMGEVAAYFKRRAFQLENIRDTRWPK